MTTFAEVQAKKALFNKIMHNENTAPIGRGGVFYNTE